MSFWDNLNIRKKLIYSILALTAVLALTAGAILFIIAGFIQACRQKKKPDMQ